VVSSARLVSSFVNSPSGGLFMTLRPSVCRISLLLVCTVASAFAAGCQGPLERRSGTSSLRVAVVDLNKVFEESLRRRGQEDVLNDLISKEKPRIGALRDRVLELKKQFDAIDKNDPERADLEQKLRDAADEHRKELKESERRVSRLMGEAIQSFRAEARREINALGVAGNYDLILERSIELEGARPAGVPSFKWEVVHFVRPSLDLTGEVVQRLNRRYLEEQKEAERGASAPKTAPSAGDAAQP